MITRLTHIAKGNTFLKNFSVLTVSSVLTQILAMIIGIKIARILSPYNFGVYNLLQLHVTIFAVIASLGIRRIIIRNIARDKTNVNGLLKSSMILRFFGVLFAVAAFCVYYYFFRSYEVVLFGLVILSVLMMVSFDYFDSLAFGLEKMEFSGFVNLMSTICWLFAILLIPEEYLKLSLIFIVFTVYTCLKAIIFFLVIRSRTNYSANPSAGIQIKNGALTLGRESLPFYYLDLFTLLSMQVPILFLEYRSGTEQIGYFNIAIKVLLPITLVVNTSLSAIFPVISRLYTNNYKRFISTIKNMFVGLTIFGISGAFAATLFREDIVVLLYGEKYLSSSLVLGYQAWYVAVFAIVCLMGTILGAINRQKELSYLSLVCTLIQVPILWYGSQFGAQYLSAAFLVATAINMILHFYVINRYVKNKVSIMFYFKISALIGIGYVLSLNIPSGINLSMKISMFVIVAAIAGFFLYHRYAGILKEFFQK